MLLNRADPALCGRRSHGAPAIALLSSKPGSVAGAVELSVVRTFQLGLLCGAVAGFTVDAVLFPLDTLKTRLQVIGGGTAKSAQLLRGLYLGFGPAVAASAPAAAAFFGTYDYAKRELEKRFDESQKPLAHLIAAAAGDVAGSTIRAPFEVVKQQLQSGLHVGTHSAVSSIWKAKGVRGFFAGYGSLVIRELPFDAIQFPLYELFKVRWAEAKQAKLTTVESSICGSAAGAVAAAITTPLDVVKTRLMTQTSAQYNGVVHGLRKIAHEEGAAALFSGIGPRVVWISVGGALFFGAYEATKAALFPSFEHEQRKENGDQLEV